MPYWERLDHSVLVFYFSFRRLVVSCTMLCIVEVLTVLSLFQDPRLKIVRVQKPNYEAHCSLLVRTCGCCYSVLLENHYECMCFTFFKP